MKTLRLAGFAVSAAIALVILNTGCGGGGFSEDSFFAIQSGMGADEVESDLGEPDHIDEDAEYTLDGWTWCDGDTAYRVYIDDENQDEVASPSAFPNGTTTRSGSDEYLGAASFGC